MVCYGIFWSGQFEIAGKLTPPTLKQEDGHFLLYQNTTCEIKRKDHGESKHGLNIIIRIVI